MLYQLRSLLLLCGLLCLTIFTASAGNINAGKLKGKITDEQNVPLTGAVISIPDLHVGATADSNGDYVISNIPQGKYLVEVRMLSYANITEAVTISGVTTHDFKLKETVLERNEVVITGTSLATEERKSVTPIQSIRMKQLQENISTNIIDAITKLPGVSQLTTGPAVSKPIIRGLGYNRIITLNDGVRQEGQQWGDEHGIEIDDYNVSRIEVLKGPASLAYGSDALAGVINIISDDPLPEGKIRGNVTANYQTNNGQEAIHAQLGGNNNGIVWNGYYTGKRAHDYKNPYDGYVFDSRYHNNNFGATIGMNKKWGSSKLSFTSFNQILGISEGERDSATGKFIKAVDDNGVPGEAIVTDDDGRSYSRATPSQQINHQKLVWANNLYFNNGGRIGLTLGYQQNSRKEFEDVLNPTTPGLSFLLKTYSYDLKYFFPVWKGWQVTSGINGMVQHNENKGNEFLIPDYNLFDIGGYAIAKKDWKRWSVSGGLRYNYRKITSDALYTDSSGERTSGPVAGGEQRFQQFNTSFSNISGSLGASYALTEKTILKFNFASGFRAPNIAELSANGVHEGTIRYEYGNLGLKPETSFQGDIGINWSSDHVQINGAVFYNHIQNFIYIRKLLNASGKDSIPEQNNDQGYPAFIYDQTNATLYGGELYVDLHPHPFDWLHLENTFSYVRGVTSNNTDSTHNLPYIPAARWLIELRAQQKKMGSFLRNVYAKVGVDINFAQNNVFTAYNTETASPGYTLLNAGVGMDFVGKKQNTLFTLTLAAQNLTDVAYQNHLSRLRYADINYVTGRQGIFNMGRSFSITVSVPLDIK
ncbi:TonB-dependent receptor [Taibaiella soli]|uniref:TonB-dependent receptor n=1 Tax=Taibaiella soli TaxID=1649169 RepID=UPI001A9E25B4|nr:TonB-dependent receptor [Taibaiella soli]